MTIMIKRLFKLGMKWQAVFIGAFFSTLLICSSVVQASDMQIYAVPTAGKKTIVMMLDTSGSMGYYVASGYSLSDDYGLTTSTCSVVYEASATTPSYPRYFCSIPATTTNSAVTNPSTGCEKQSDDSYRCYDRLTRLKDGMFAFLENDNPVLPLVRVGLGHFSSYTDGTTSGDGTSGEILVPAAELGSVGSAQREALKIAVAELVASGGTPTANAYAEAAAYLMGTSTALSTVMVTKDFYKAIAYQCQDSGYTRFNPNDSKCYKYENFSGSTVAGTKIYDSTSCNSFPATPYLNVSQAKCWQYNFSGTSVAGTKNYNASSCSTFPTAPYLNSADNRCYTYNNFSGGTAAPAYQCTSSTYKYLRTTNNKCYTNTSYSGLSIDATKDKCSSTRPYFNDANDTCYQYNYGYSGGGNTAIPSSYSCSGSTPYLNTANNTCYQYNTAGTGTSNTAVPSSYSCPVDRPYLNPANNTCYANNFGYSGGSINAVTSPTSGSSIVNYYKCKSWQATDFINRIQQCNGRTGISSSNWTVIGTSVPSDISSYTAENDFTGAIYYTRLDTQTTNVNSGFAKSISTSKVGDTYSSPLPATADRVSCDGQGVYLLSDGEPTNNVDTTVLATSLNQSSFNCNESGALSGGTNWNCMSTYAKKLFNGGTIQSNAGSATNPANVAIQTAFVGFGSALTNLSSINAINACKLSSRTLSDRTGDDKCSPNQLTNAVTSPGYGNGGFFPTQTPRGVTDSVIAFINNLGALPIAPLNTGAMSVPVDPLNPTGLQPYGYLRALEPDPASSNIIWRGNLKKYNALLTGTNAGAFTAADGSLVFETTNNIQNKTYIGDFKAGTRDLWNSAFTYVSPTGATETRQYNDGGIINLGGTYAKVPMPMNGLPQLTNASGSIIQYAQRTTPSALRTLFTDVASVTDSTLNGLTATNSNLLRIPASPETTPSSASQLTSDILSKFASTTGQTTLKDFPIAIKLKLLNYLGYPVDTELTTLPSSLSTPATPNLAMGGSIHSFPVQLTYEGTLDSRGNLTSARNQSIMYGTMDGGLHVVNASTGVEEMVFVPSVILKDPMASNGLVKGKTGSVNPGVDGAWVADPAYNFTSTTTGNTTTTRVTARKMNVYGGLRMGGSSYYGLDLTNKNIPKFLFRIGADQAGTDFSTMGQSWSKPVLANIRYNGVITRVMIVGGGYDTCYENPRFKLGTTNANTDYPDAACNGKPTAKGNAIYMVNAKTGALLWWASNSGANTNNANMKHSIVSRISTLDRNADGLIDHLYFGDLGGQVFRADLNNEAKWSTGESNTFGVRVVRMANLGTSLANGTNTSGALNGSDSGDSPRFYEPPTVTIHDANGKTFILVGLASGDRSTPLDVSPRIGREGMIPKAPLSGRPTNKVYGIMDRDFIKANLISGSPALLTENLTIADLQQNPQLQSVDILISNLVGDTPSKQGWYRSLSSKFDGTEVSGRTPGAMKAFEEAIALTNNLFVPVYDPEGTGINAAGDPCLPRIIGESDWQQYCLPFGVCLTSNGAKDSVQESKTGFKLDNNGKNSNVIGSGIRGIALAPKTITDNGGNTGANSCGGITLAGNAGGTGEWSCTTRLIPTRWYEKYQ